MATLANQIRADPLRLGALNAARAQGWDPLLAVFRAQGIDIFEGKPRRRADLGRGLVMVDRSDRRRKLKISALDTANEKWSSFALIRELGPMPARWQEHFTANHVESQAAEPPGIAPSEEPMPSMQRSDPALAETFLADGETVARLRAARTSRRWDILIEAFRAEGRGIEVGYNAKRGIESGLVLVDLSNPQRRIKLSILDSSTEKWGRTALEQELGPWPGSATELLATGDVDADEANLVDLVSAPPPSGRLPYFDRQVAFISFQAAKASSIAHNRALRPSHDLRRAALFRRQAAERHLHYTVRRTRRDLVRTVFGRKSATALILNELLDALFAVRLHRLAERHRLQRAKQRDALAAERVIIPLWPDALRAAQQAHAYQILHEKEDNGEITPFESSLTAVIVGQSSNDAVTQTVSTDTIETAQASGIQAEAHSSRHGIPLARERDLIIGQTIWMMSDGHLKRAELEALAALIPSTPDWVWSQAKRVCRNHYNGRGPHQLTAVEKIALQSELQLHTGRVQRVVTAVRNAGRSRV